MSKQKDKNLFTPEMPELWKLCMKHGGKISRREGVGQLLINDMYDEIIILFKSQKTLPAGKVGVK